MSKLNRKEAKKILIDWKDFLILSEASEKDLKLNLDEEIYNEFNINKSRLGKLQDVYFNAIIINSYNSGDIHGVEEFILLYEEYKTHILSKRNRTEDLVIELSDGTKHDLNEKLNFNKGHNDPAQTATYQDIISWLNVRREKSGLSSKKTQDVLSKEFKQSYSKKSNIFELIYEDNDWIVFYPNKQFASKILARSVYIGKELVYDKTAITGYGKLTKRMTWCTSSEGANAFLQFKSGNMHMYYIIKKFKSFDDLNEFNKLEKGDKIQKEEHSKRKLCLSFVKLNNRIEFAGKQSGYMCVDGNNKKRDINWFESTLGNVFNVIEENAKLPEKKDFDYVAYIKTVSFEAYKNTRKALENPSEFTEEFKMIIKHSRDRNKIIAYSCDDDSVDIRETLVNNMYQMEDDICEYVVEVLIEDKNPKVRSLTVTKARIEHFNQDVIETIKKDISLSGGLSYRNDLIEIDKSLNVLAFLAKHENNNIKRNIITNLEYTKALVEKFPEGFNEEYDMSLLTDNSSLGKLDYSINYLNKVKQGSYKEYEELLTYFRSPDYNLLYNTDLYKTLKKDDKQNVDVTKLFYELFIILNDKAILYNKTITVSIRRLFNLLYESNDFFNSDGPLINSLNTNSVYMKKFVNKTYDFLEQVNLLDANINSNKHSKRYESAEERQASNPQANVHILYFTSNFKHLLPEEKKSKLEKNMSDNIELLNSLALSTNSKKQLSTVIFDLDTLCKSLDIDKSDIATLINNIINRVANKVKISKHAMICLLDIVSENEISINHNLQKNIVNSLTKSDYDSMKFFLKYNLTSTENYLYVIRNTLPKKGRGPSFVYHDLMYINKTYKMLEIPEISNEFVQLANKSLLNKIIVTMSEKLEYNSNVDHRGGTPLHILSKLDISTKSMITFYNSLISSEKGMSIKKNRINLEKALKNLNLIEVKYLENSKILLERYIKEIISYQGL